MIFKRLLLLRFIAFFSIFLLITPGMANNLRLELQKRINAPTPKWMIDQINADMSNSTVITTCMIDKTFQESDGHLSRYKIFNGKITCNDKGNSPLANIFRSFILELNSLVKLPDVDFIIITDDYPVEHKSFQIPVFGFCKCHNRPNVILVPDYQILDLVKNQDIMNQIREGILKYPWNKKIGKALWRGGNTGGITVNNFHDSPRVKIVDLSKQFPDLLNARINRVYDYSIISMLKASDYLGNTLSIIEQMAYKYQLLIDGNCASWPGAFWRFHSNCVVFKQTSDQAQWYYSLLKPWVHYIPIANDLHDLIEKIHWARNNDQKVQEIIKNANQIASSCLTYEAMLYYIYVAISIYAKLQKN